jgi:uncharacterized protein YjaZ
MNDWIVPLIFFGLIGMSAFIGYAIGYRSGRRK